MESIVYVGSIAVCAFVAAELFLAPISHIPQALILIKAKTLALRFVRACAQKQSIRALADQQTVSVICRALVSKLQERGFAIGETEACVLLLTGLVIAFVGIGLFSLSFISPLLCLCSCIAFAPMIAHHIENAKTQKLSHDMPDIFRTLGMALAAGQTFSQAIAYVGKHQKGAAGLAFEEASLKLRCGSSISEVLLDIAQNLHAPGVTFLVTALLISQRTGAPLKELFRKSAGLVEDQEKFKRLLTVKTAQVRMSVRVVVSLPVILICVLSCISRDFQLGLTKPVGMVCLIIAFALDSVALVCMRVLMRGVLRDE